MARKPADQLTGAKGYKTPRQMMWEMIRVLRSGFSLAGLLSIGAPGLHRATIVSYLQGLEAGGYVERIDLFEAVPTPGNKAWRLVRDVGHEAPRVTKDGKPVVQGQKRENMWRSMRMTPGDFSWRDLAISASVEGVLVSEVDAKDYCKHLALAGYLIVVAKGSGRTVGKGSTPTRYRFNRAKNTGPRPPMIQRMQTVFDPNLGKIVWHPAVDE